MAALMDLLPCPFCGEAGVLDGETMRGQTFWRAGCDNPNCVVKAGHCDTDRDAAIAAWNHRLAHSDPRPVAVTQLDENGEAMICAGCGTTRTIAGIAQISKTAFSCCPERKMIPASDMWDAWSAATHSPAPTEAGLFARRPQLASIEAGPEPSLRQMVRFYYVEHGQPDPEADTEAYFDALSSTQGGAEG